MQNRSFSKSSSPQRVVRTTTTTTSSPGRKVLTTITKTSEKFSHLTEKRVSDERFQVLEEEIRRERELSANIHADNELLVKRVAEYERLLHEKSESENRLLKEKSRLEKELHEASSYISSLETKCFDANSTSLELLTSVRDLESEVETLKAYIIDLKSRIAVYIPIKNDTIDKKLAEYINNYPDRQKLKIMFMRESEGVYEFGSKKVKVSVARDKIQIKVGGGFLSIDEFLDQYTPAELEKLERRDPLKRFNERVAVQKIINDKNGVETSPVRRQESPVRAMKQRPATGSSSVGKTRVQNQRVQQESTYQLQQRQYSQEEIIQQLTLAGQALQSLKKSDLTEMASFANPPKLVQDVISATAILMGEKPEWAEARKMIKRQNFIECVKCYDKDNIDPATIKKLQPYLTKPDFTVKHVTNCSVAAGSLCSWVLAMNDYHYWSSQL